MLSKDFCRENLCMSQLPGYYIRPDSLLDGLGIGSYEQYLLEFVNSIDYFLYLSHGEKYMAPPSQAKHECDCISTYYRFDFKLFCSKGLLQASSIFTDRKIFPKNLPSVEIDTAPKMTPTSKGYSPIQATRIHALFRQFDIETMLQNPQMKDDVLSLLDTLEEDKHILLFFPYTLYFKSLSVDLQEGIETICNCLMDDFRRAFEYRVSKQLKFDTYFSFIYSSWDGSENRYFDYFVTTRYVDDALDVIGRTSISASKTFEKIYRVASIPHGRETVRIKVLDSDKPATES